MRMQKGLCIELNGESSIFLVSNGEFVQGKPAGDLAVGEEGYYYPKQELVLKKRKADDPVWAPVLAAIAIAVLFLSVLLPKQEAFAYVQVQVNPGVELGIDEAYNVISIRGLNEDGRELVGELGEWKHHSLEEVLDDVIALSMKEATEEIVITTVADDKDEIADEKVVDSVMAISTKVMKDDVTVRLKEATKKQWRSSVEKSVPVGQLINRSEKLTKEVKKKELLNEKENQPANVKQQQPKADKPQKTDLKAEEKVKKAEEKVKKTEVKPEKADIKKENEKNESKVKGEKAPSTDRKSEPPGQEKRKETPAAEKGNPQPHGQDKRHEMPGKIKQNDAKQPDKPSPGNGKEKAPEKQKKKENKGNNADKGNSSKVKEDKPKPKPADSGPQNSHGKNHMNNQDAPGKSQVDQNSGKKNDNE